MAADFAEPKTKLPEGVAIPEGFFDTLLAGFGKLRQPGGTGTIRLETSALSCRSNRRDGLKLVVAGGLTPQNVGEAMSVLHPWGVDVVSGVEASLGKKDPEKVRAFVKAVREMDRKVG